MTSPLEHDHRPPYVQVAEYLRRQIQSGTLGPGDQLPTSRELQEKFGIASATVQNAFRMLKAEGLTYGIQGRGSFVRRHDQEAEAGAGPESAEGDAPSGAPPKPPTDDRYFRLSMEVEEMKHTITIMKRDMDAMFRTLKTVAAHIEMREQ